MEMFSNCSGPCCLCNCLGVCLAGHGDDDFYPATDEQLLERLYKKPHYRDEIIEELKHRGVRYNENME